MAKLERSKREYYPNRRRKRKNNIYNVEQRHIAFKIKDLKFQKRRALNKIYQIDEKIVEYKNKIEEISINKNWRRLK